jgi:hypothetical protein
MNEEERKWQQFEEHLRQAEEEQQKPQPDLFFQRSIGCLIGGILGPVFLFGLLYINALLNPEAEAGGLLSYLIAFIMAVPIGGISTAILSPFIVKWVRKLWDCNPK